MAILTKNRNYTKHRKFEKIKNSKNSTFCQCIAIVTNNQNFGYNWTKILQLDKNIKIGPKIKIEQ